MRLFEAATIITFVVEVTSLTPSGAVMGTETISYPSFASKPLCDKYVEQRATTMEILRKAINSPVPMQRLVCKELKR